jgi:hypothetical protein
VFAWVKANPGATREDALDWAKAEGLKGTTVLTQFWHAHQALKAGTL